MLAGLMGTVAALLINPDAFFVITMLLIIMVSSKSLKQLFILNFASDAAYEKYISEARPPSTKKELFLSRTVIFCLNALFVLFFVYAFLTTTSILIKIISAVITATWSYDILKTLANILSPKSSDSNWTWKDNLAETYMWLQNIASIVFTVVLFAARFPIFS